MLTMTTLVLLAGGPAAPLPTIPKKTVVPPMFYSEIVGKAQQIVTGTVTKSVCKYERGKETIVTYVTLAVRKIHKGKVGKTLTLRFVGGRMGEDILMVPLMPQLEVGTTYLLYVDGLAGKKVSPIVGFFQGCFEVTRKDDREILRSLNGDELIGIEKDRFVFAVKATVKAQKTPKAVKTGVQFKEADPDVDAKEAAQAIVDAEAARASRKPLEYEAGTPGPAVVKGKADAPPTKNKPTNDYDRRRMEAVPKVITPDQDSGYRLSVAALMTRTEK